MRRSLTLPIETARLRVRRLRRSDLEAFMAYRADPDVGRYQGWTAMDAEASLAFLEDMSRTEGLAGGDWLQLAIADRESDELLGDIGLHPDSQCTELEIGFTLAASRQGQGLATEAVAATLAAVARESGIPRARAVTDARNAPSIALLERLGFRRLSEQTVVFRGERCVEYVYRLDGPPVVRW